MERIVVVGSGGAGKSTLARTLGARLDLPVVHLDEHYWRPGWIATEPAAWRERQRELLSGGRWIADGNYSGTLDVRLAGADTVVILALPRWRCLLGVARRWIAHRGRAVQAPGCPERLTVDFLRWVWDYPKGGRARLDAAIRAHARPETRLLELSSRRQVRRFLRAAIDP